MTGLESRKSNQTCVLQFFHMETPIQPIAVTRGIEWTKVTWYSRLGALLLFMGVVPVLCFYIGTQYALTQTSSQHPVAATSPLGAVAQIDTSTKPEWVVVEHIAQNYRISFPNDLTVGNASYPAGYDYSFYDKQSKGRLTVYAPESGKGDKAYVDHLQEINKECNAGPVGTYPSPSSSETDPAAPTVPRYYGFETQGCYNHTGSDGSIGGYVHEEKTLNIFIPSKNGVFRIEASANFPNLNQIISQFETPAI